MRYSEMLDGRSCHMPVSELAGGARIRHIFQEIFVTGLQELNPSGRAPRPPRFSCAFEPLNGVWSVKVHVNDTRDLCKGFGLW